MLWLVQKMFVYKEKLIQKMDYNKGVLHYLDLFNPLLSTDKSLLFITALVISKQLMSLINYSQVIYGELWYYSFTGSMDILIYF